MKNDIFTVKNDLRLKISFNLAFLISFKQQLMNLFCRTS